MEGERDAYVLWMGLSGWIIVHVCVNRSGEEILSHEGFVLGLSFYLDEELRFS